MADLAANWSFATPHQQLCTELKATLEDNRSSLGDTLKLALMRTPKWLRSHHFGDLEAAALAEEEEDDELEIVTPTRKHGRQMVPRSAPAEASRRSVIKMQQQQSKYIVRHKVAQDKIEAAKMDAHRQDWSGRFALESLPRYNQQKDPHCHLRYRQRAKRTVRRSNLATAREWKERKAVRAEKLAGAKARCASYKNRIKMARIEANRAALDALHAPSSYSEMLLKIADEDDAIEEAYAEREGRPTHHQPVVVEEHEPVVQRGLVYKSFVSKCKRRAHAEVNDPNHK